MLESEPVVKCGGSRNSGMIGSLEIPKNKQKLRKLKKNIFKHQRLNLKNGKNNLRIG